MKHHKPSNLSKRENEVLNLLIKGMANKHIALELSVSEKTVEKLCTRLYRKMNVDGRASAIIKN